MVVYARYPEKAAKDSYTPLVIKIQTLITFLLLAILPFCFFFEPMPVYIFPGLVSVVLLTSIPFSLTVFKNDKTVGILSPFYCLLRAVVFATGSFGGIMSVVANKIRKN